MKTTSRDLSRNLATIAIGLTLALVLGEGVLRVAGKKPWTDAVFANEPTMHAPDPVLGWRNKQGSYIVSPYHSSGKPIHVTFGGSGERTTGGGEAESDRELVIVGGSYVQGWAISDPETFAWKIRERYPGMKVLNYGTAGYGTYQSLLVLEKELPRMHSPCIVLYGFIEHHEQRNVASGDWLRSLSMFSRRAHVDVPFATLDDSGELLRHAQERYLSLPFRESLATVALLEEAAMTAKTWKRLEQKREVTEALLLQLDEVSTQYGARLFVVFLESRLETKDHYIEFLQRNGIKYIVSVVPRTNEMMVPGEGHPNGRINSLWASPARYPHLALDICRAPRYGLRHANPEPRQAYPE